MDQLSGHERPRLTCGYGLRTRGRGWWVPVLLVLFAPLLLGGAWQEISGNTINPSYVKRIQDGKTTKNEILLYFGDPKTIERTADGQVYKYFSYKDAPALPYKPWERQVNENSTDNPNYILDQDKQIKKPQIKTEGKILRSRLVIRFKADGETVMSHEYKEF